MKNVEYSQWNLSYYCYFTHQNTTACKIYGGANTKKQCYSSSLGFSIAPVYCSSIVPSFKKVISFPGGFFLELKSKFTNRLQ